MYKLSKSSRADKKFMVTTPEGKKIYFGAVGYQDYTMHKDKERRNRYLLRHSTNEDWNNKNTPGFWARWLLWNKPTLKKSIKDISNRFDISITLG